MIKFYIQSAWFWLTYHLGGRQVLLSDPRWTLEPLSEEDLNNF